MAKQEKVSGEQAQKWVKQNVGFWIQWSDAQQKPLVVELGTGKIIRPATAADIARWNKKWNKVMGKVYEHNKIKDSYMLLDYEKLVVRFEEIKASYGRATTMDEKLDLLAQAQGLLRQAEQQVAQLRADIARLNG
jgi:hypothetical protein